MNNKKTIITWISTVPPVICVTGLVFSQPLGLSETTIFILMCVSVIMMYFSGFVVFKELSNKNIGELK